MKVTNRGKINLTNSEITVNHAGYSIVLQLLVKENGIWIDTMHKNGVEVKDNSIKMDMEEELEDYHFIINEDRSVKIELS